MPRTRRPSFRLSLLTVGWLLVGWLTAGLAHGSAQVAPPPIAASSAPAPPSAAPAAASRNALGTVKAVDGGSITLQTAAGSETTVRVGPETRYLQLPPGSTDIRTAQAATLGDVAPGDRILATASAGGPVAPPPAATSPTASSSAATPFQAVRVILMKGGLIAARNASAEADWQQRGTGGLVRSIDGPLVTVSDGTRIIMVQTTSATIFRRYTAGSVRFADARPGTLAEIKVGDQMRVRGDRRETPQSTAAASGVTSTQSTPTGAAPGILGRSHAVSVVAEEIVSGSFRNLSGVVTAVDPAAGTVTVQDALSKAPVTVLVTASSELKRLTPEGVAALKARSERLPTPATAAEPTTQSTRTPRAQDGAELTALMARLPTQTLVDLHPGDTVLLVASGGEAGDWTTITLLSGAESLLPAPGASGSKVITLSPWNLGAPEGGL